MTQRSTRERNLEEALAALERGPARAAENALVSLVLREAAQVARTLGPAVEPDELAALWLRKNLEGLRATWRSRRDRRPGALIAHLRRGLRSRGIDVWRAEYASRNPVAQYFYVRFGKALRRSTTLMERGGFVTLRGRRNLPPGNPEHVSIDLVTPRPPRPEPRASRLRSPSGAESLYEPWMVACIALAGGKLKRRMLAEMLATVHGEPRLLPGYRAETVHLNRFRDLQFSTPVEPFGADEDDEF